MIKNVLAAILVFSFFSVITIIITAFVASSGCITPNPPQTVAVYSIDFGQEVDGSFSLGSGYVETDNYYYFYVQDMDGAYHLKKSLVENSRIFMDSNVTKETAYAILYDCFCDHDCPNICQHTHDAGAEFHVPKGTITRQFNANVRSHSNDNSDDYTTTYIATQYMNPSNPASPMYYR